MVGVALGADLEDSRIDVDGVDMLRALGESNRDVRARAGPHDEDVLQGLALEMGVRQSVLRFEGQSLRRGSQICWWGMPFTEICTTLVPPCVRSSLLTL